MNRKRVVIILVSALLLIVILNAPIRFALCHINKFQMIDYLPFISRCEVPLLISSSDQNKNGTADALDIVLGARQEVEGGTVYDASFYQQGYPPEGRGACTDVVWRAYRYAGYDLKSLLDKDIKSAPSAYGQTGNQPEPAIDFRRVSNLRIFFARHGETLTTVVKPGQADNLAEWQPGDIVTFGLPLEHIGVISDRRRRDGVPLMIHNAGPKASEGDYLLAWPTAITGHYRFPQD